MIVNDMSEIDIDASLVQGAALSRTEVTVVDASRFLDDFSSHDMLEDRKQQVAEGDERSACTGDRAAQ